MNQLSLSVPAYRREVGVVAPVEGGTVLVRVVDGAVELSGDPAGLRDLARWCLSLSDSSAPDGSHIHLDPGTVPLSLQSTPLTIARDDGIDAIPD
ncbi:Imm32 family immunity protein [Kribbella sp. ALI-6-A]|uniref:Imm32 family immunity protein n=1 Tax=Kribbella sp. ALI-6-A TaxID=1933817 RepID=UPI00117A8AA0|nr:hypothetical protein [Kribbella sp. ALI-6-A]